MRDIKFRAWDTNKMIDVKVLEYVPAHKSFNGKPGYNVNYHLGIPAENLMQYTGLKDKNGKEIYEGDIVETLEDGNAEVIFQDGIFGCKVERPQSTEGGTEFYEEFISLNDLIDSGYWGSSDGIKEPYFILEVIGNIYENPELLKDNH